MSGVRQMTMPASRPCHRGFVSSQPIWTKECDVARHQMTRQVFKIAVVSLAVLGGLVEWAALLRARLNLQITGLRRV
jgi:hypothetical protein